jgi:hypothetical protein
MGRPNLALEGTDRGREGLESRIDEPHGRCAIGRERNAQLLFDDDAFDPLGITALALEGARDVLSAPDPRLGAELRDRQGEDQHGLEVSTVAAVLRLCQTPADVPELAMP